MDGHGPGGQLGRVWSMGVLPILLPEWLPIPLPFLPRYSFCVRHICGECWNSRALRVPEAGTSVM